MLVGISTMLAMKTELDEFYISPEETESFLKAAQNVARHYSVETTQKTLDWIAFAGIGVQVFGTRAVAISVKLKDKRASPGKARPSAKVHQLHEVPAGGLDIRPDDTAGSFDGLQ